MLRIKAPKDIRPFKIPLNIAGLIAMTLLPFSVYIIAVVAGFSASANSLKSILFAIGVILSGEIIWRIIVWRNPKVAEQAVYFFCICSLNNSFIILASNPFCNK